MVRFGRNNSDHGLVIGMDGRTGVVLLETLAGRVRMGQAALLAPRTDLIRDGRDAQWMARRQAWMRGNNEAAGRKNGPDPKTT